MMIVLPWDSFEQSPLSNTNSIETKPFLSNWATDGANERTSERANERTSERANKLTS